MKRITVLSLIMLLVSFYGFSKSRKINAGNQVIVEISYGKDLKEKQVSIAWEENLTALEALQKVADVKTHPIKNYVFVIEIDDVLAKRGDMAWYYSINGTLPRKLAIQQPVLPGDTIRWRYVKDVCSGKVDGCKTN
ncbi:MAG: DUF4430 domain-containing protein [Prolixibacteraceae bacterium]